MTDPTVEGRAALKAVVVVASNRAAAGVYDDTTGPLIVETLRGLGFAVDDAVVRPDGEPVGAAIELAVRDGARVVLTTGGTGLTPTDLTPDVTRPLLDREVPGLAEAVRAHGVAKGVPTAALSRGLAGVSGTAPRVRGHAFDLLLPSARHYRHAGRVVAHRAPQGVGVGLPDLPGILSLVRTVRWHPNPF